MSLHYTNQILHPTIVEAIPEDERILAEEIVSLLEKLRVSMQTNAEVDVKLTGRLIKLLKTYNQLKYTFEESFRSNIVQTFLSVYEKPGFVPLNQKTQLLKYLKVLLKKDWPFLSNFSLDWKLFWDELISIIERQERYNIIGTDTILQNHMKTLADFLSKTRHYINPYLHGLSTTSKYGYLVDFAMERLSDLRVLNSIEGLVLLVNCLPTKYDHYDELLPQWFDIWSSVTKNTVWDCCWLVIISRARKFSKTFDWSNKLPFILTKTRELLQLPSMIQIAGSQSNAFPKYFPSFYQNVLTFNEIQKKISVKLSKLTYRCILHNQETSKPELFSITPPIKVKNMIEQTNLQIPGYVEVPSHFLVKKSSLELLMSLQIIRPFIHPSNSAGHLINYVRYLYGLISSISKTFSSVIVDNIASPNSTPINEIDYNTNQYILSMVLSHALEGLYSKNNTANNIYLLCLKQIIILNPQWIHCIIPYVMMPLDPSVVSQPKQTLTSIHTLSSLLRMSLYPEPVMLRYLPEIMKLILPGIDASDANKTVITLDLYSALFSWIPLTSSANISFDINKRYWNYVPNYSQLSGIVHPQDLESVYRNDLEVLLSYIKDEWTPVFVDKISTLINGFETKVKGTKQTPMVSSVAQCVGYLFQAIGSDWDDYRIDLEDKFLQYTLHHAPIHTSKVCGKILENMVVSNPARLSEHIPLILTADVLDLEATSEKIAFRLVLAGACCRCSTFTAIAPYLPLFQSIIVNPKFLYHEDTKIRKSLGKFLKDAMKGCTATYPINTTPLFPGSTVLGGPSIPNADSLKWHSSTVESLSEIVPIIRSITSFCQQEISDVLKSIQGLNPKPSVDENKMDVDDANNSSQVTLSYKKSEDLLVSNLALIRKFIRGIAEIIGDVDATLYAQSPSEDIWSKPTHFLTTGREQLFRQLPVEDRVYLANYRVQWLSFMNNLHLQLDQLASTGFASLRNNEQIAKQYVKIVVLLLTRRLSFLKDIENIKKWFKYDKQVNHSYVCANIYKSLKQSSILTNSSHNTKELLAYWKFSHLNTNSVSTRAWLQHALRNSILSLQTIKHFIQMNDTNNIYVQSIYSLVALSQHEYDKIRPIARKQLERFTVFLGQQTTVIIQSMFTKLFELSNQDNINLANENTSGSLYAKSTSIFVLLKQGHFMKRVINNIDLKNTFLKNLINVQSIASAITDTERREKLLLALTEAVLKYKSTWFHTNSDLHHLYNDTYGYILSLFGLIVAELPSFASVLGNNASFQIISNGIRFDTFLSYILLHLLDLELLKYPEYMKATWILALYLFTTAHGQPTQQIAFAMISRLAEITFVAQQQGLLSSGQPNSIWFQELTTFITQDLNVNLENGGFWTKLMLGFIRGHVSIHQEDSSNHSSSPQYSMGMDTLIASSYFLAVTKPRSFYHKRFETNVVSHFFRKDVASIFYNFTHLKWIPLSQETDITTFTSLFKRPLLLSNEHEQRLANDLRSELFAGVLRAFHSFEPNDRSVELDIALNKIFWDMTDSLSIDYAKDWNEALLFGQEDARLSQSWQNELTKQVLEKYFSLMKSSNPVTDASVSNEGSTSNESFSRHAKIFMYLHYLLEADCIASIYHRSNNNAELFVAKNVLQFLLSLDPVQLTITFRVSRGEFAGIFSSLFYYASKIESNSLIQLLVNLSQIVTSQELFNLQSQAPLEIELETVVSPGVEVTSMEVESTNETTEASSVKSTQVVSSSDKFLKNKFETILTIILCLVGNNSSTLCTASLLPIFLPLLLQSMIFHDSDVIKSTTDTFALLFHNCYMYLPMLQPRSTFNLTHILEEHFVKLPKEKSIFQHWRIEQNIQKALVFFLVHNWFNMDADSRKLFKDIFSSGLSLEKNPAVQESAKIGMIAYLSSKTMSEMKTIAEIYNRNSEALATREKQKRKQLKSDTTSTSTNNKIEPMYFTTIQMISCVIVTYSFDLPAFIPNLLISFLRHTHYYDVAKNLVTKTVQLFKRSHQDQWEEFKLAFTLDQLDELQGAGAAHYFS